MDLGLRDRVAIVTGSSRGIGLAIATALAVEGARVVLNARGPDSLNTAVNVLANAGHQVRGVRSDVSTDDGCKALVEGALLAFGCIDLLVNNVGGSKAASLDSPLEEWQDGMNQTVWSSLRLTRLVVPHMRRQGGGVILMITSIFGREAGGRPGYQVAKSAQISLCKALARELAPDHIRVVNVAPGSILFPGGSWWRRREASPEEMERFVAQEMPLARFGRPEEVASVVAFLCSAQASLVTGTSVAVDGAQGRSIL